jgi:topoisomerase-4 subunit A
VSEQSALQPIVLEDVVGDCFARYSKYIIQDRAIPDVRDGLKPVQRRILYAMYEAGNTPDKPYRKSAKTVGDVMGNYHPHGESSIYDGMVRLAQPWKMAHPLLDGHGNWGSMDDDPAAAMRYTEARLSPLALVMLRDIDKNTVMTRDNFDNTLQEPIVLPAHFPNLLVNGASGISAGFATDIPTHNLGEVIDACVVMLDNPQVSLPKLMQHVRGPDFPTGGMIVGTDGIVDAYKTGKGKLIVRARTTIEDVRGGRQHIVITDIPYGVVKSKLVMAIEHIRLDKKIDGIAEVRDESGREGLRIVIELKKEVDAQAIIHYLYKKTDLQLSMSVNMVAIVNKAPQVVGLKTILQHFLEHEKNVILKRSAFDLQKAADKEHILAGFARIWIDLDAVIALVRKAATRNEAAAGLVQSFGLSAAQAEAILGMPLYRLTRMEISAIERQLAEVRGHMDQLKRILQEEHVLVQTIKDGLHELRKKFAIARRTDIVLEDTPVHVNTETLIASEDVWVTISVLGMMKRTSVLSYTRSGGDVRTAGCNSGDALAFFRCVNTRTLLLVFVHTGTYATMAVHAIPEAKWKDAGVPMTTAMAFAPGDRVVGVVPIVFSRTDRAGYIISVTRYGWIKTTDIGEYGAQRTTPVGALRLQADDELLYVGMTIARHETLWLVTNLGTVIRCALADIAPKPRTAVGVRVKPLRADDALIAVIEGDGVATDIVLIGQDGTLARIPLAATTDAALARALPEGQAWIGAVGMHAASLLRIVPDRGEPVECSGAHVPLWNKKRKDYRQNVIRVLPDGACVKNFLKISQ